MYELLHRSWDATRPADRHCVRACRGVKHTGGSGFSRRHTGGATASRAEVLEAPSTSGCGRL